MKLARLFATLLPGAMLASCTAIADQQAAINTSSQPQLPATQAAYPWDVVEPAPISADGPRILVLHDMEGLSGQDDPETFFRQFEGYAEGQKLLAADINAVVDGLFAAGAKRVDVTDGHGSGNVYPDVLTELLDPRAKQLFRDSFYDPYLDLALEEQYDAIVQVGAHARTGSGGFAAHTITLGMDVRLDDIPISESEFFALSWGRVGSPLIFVSGDDVLQRELAETMPWIEFGLTKYAINAGSARLRPVDEARADLRAGAKRALENFSRMKAMQLRTPVKVTVRAVAPASLRSLREVPGLDYSEPGLAPSDSAVSFEAGDYIAAMRGMFGLVTAARGGYMQSLIDQYAREGDRGAFDRFYEKRFRTWIAQESGTLTPAPPRWNPDEMPEHFHGIQ